MFAEQEALFHQGIISFGGMHPDYTNYKKELLRLKEHQVPGIKLHPAYQNIDLDDIRMLRIIEAAFELGLIVLVHAGIDIGIPDHNYSSVSHILKVLHQVQPEKLVLAHMGNWSCWDEVESDLAGAPVWFDTAFSLGPVVPNPEDSLMPIRSHNLSDEAFVRLCKKHGTERILFGTDSPWQEQSDIVERLRALPFSEEEREGILGKNAASLLGLKSQISYRIRGWAAQQRKQKTRVFERFLSSPGIFYSVSSSSGSIFSSFSVFQLMVTLKRSPSVSTRKLPF